jgi:hypothetical protein
LELHVFCHFSLRSGKGENRSNLLHSGKDDNAPKKQAVAQIEFVLSGQRSQCLQASGLNYWKSSLEFQNLDGRIRLFPVSRKKGLQQKTSREEL